MVCLFGYHEWRIVDIQEETGVQRYRFCLRCDYWEKLDSDKLDSWNRCDPPEKYK